MTYPHPQSQPHPQPHPGPYAPPPQPPKRTSTGKKILIGIGAFFALVVVMSAVTSGGEETKSDTTATNSAAKGGEPADGEGGKADAGKADAEAEPAKDAPAEKSQAEQFKDFVTKNGTPQEKEAAQHITKVQGADEQNDFLDSAEVYTDYTGGLMGPHQADGKLLASAFADWKDSENGLVTIYDADGEILSNGNF